jgi:hypothetical protein
MLKFLFLNGGAHAVGDGIQQLNEFARRVARPTMRGTSRGNNHG